MNSNYIKTILATVLLLFLVVSAKTQTTMTSIAETKAGASMETLLAANDQLYNALNEMFKGEYQPISDVWSHTGDISYAGPFGGSLIGWEAIGKEFKATTDMKLGGSIMPVDVYASLNGDVGYILCVEQGSNVDQEGNPVRVSHRATTIFRYEADGWKMIHHHTDISAGLQSAWGEE